jgi:hypothetical protein
MESILLIRGISLGFPQVNNPLEGTNPKLVKRLSIVNKRLRFQCVGKIMRPEGGICIALSIKCPEVLSDWTFVQ